ncbi:sensor histidine kinase [Fulvivirga sp. RKSG066]|uniref:tetratricopeptide repeat-containing sensor histidine kinase n=1 Tax=Fulvivirga aurantia TaxID=2529383 RepID=UPI0012BD260C|nr:tetratricopeptide repeat-containing sensor histidine kinase [Fulvivirga aurantia]MTI22829.1 sensor histidine kinase [Fulvivirga aurantia]
MIKEYLLIVLCLLSSICYGQNLSDTSEVLEINKEAFKLYGSDPDQMEEKGLRALAISEKIDYEKGKAKSLNTIALANLSQANYKIASENFVAALEIFDKLSDEKSSSTILSNLGVVYYYLEDHKRSLEFHDKALEIRLQLGDSQQIAKSLNNLGIAYRNLKKPEEALNYYQKSLAYKSQLKDSLGLSSTLNNIGYIYLEQARYDEALDYLNRSLDIDKAHNAKLGIATSLLNIGEVYLESGDYSKAEDKIKEGIAVAKSSNSRQTVAIGYEHMTKLEKRRSNFREALEWQTKWIALRDSILSLEKNNEINELEAKYKTSKIRLENEALRQSNELQELQISRQKTITIVSAIITLLIIISGVLMFRAYRLKQKHLELEEQKNELITRKNLQISEQKKQLEEINQAKNRMFSILSHDLQAPVARLQSVLELASLDMLSKEELLPMFRKLSKETNNIGELLINVLQWVKSQMGGLNMVAEPTPLSTSADKVVDIYAPFALGKGISLENKISEGVIVMADVNMLKLIFRNLIANAIKFTREGGITISSDQTEDTVIVTIADTGVGMSEDDLERLFDPQPFTKEGTAREKGTGLGLLLVKEFVVKIGGTIDVQSKLGQGTVFHFTLPRA